MIRGQPGLKVLQCPKRESFVEELVWSQVVRMCWGTEQVPDKPILPSL